MIVPITRPKLRSAIVDTLRLARLWLKDLNGNGQIFREGESFGDLANDIEMLDDQLLGDLISDGLRRGLEGDLGRIVVEGRADVEIAGGSWLATVDPIDGSLNYKSRGRTLGLPYSSCVTVFDKTSDTRFRDVIAAGVVDLRCGDLWYAERQLRDPEEYLTALNGDVTCAANAGALDLGRMVVIGEMYYPMNRELLARAFAGQKGWLRNPGSAAYEMALVSSGQVAAYICDRQKNHELGAAYALVKGGCGVAVDFEGNDLGPREYAFSAQTPVVLACNRKVADEILGLIRRAS